MSSIYELTGELLQLQDLLESEIEDDALKDTLEAVTGEYEYKIESYCKIIKNLEADAQGLKDEAERLTARRKTLESNIERLKEAMFNSMKITGQLKVKGQLFTASIQRNGGKIPVNYDKEDSALIKALPLKLAVVNKKPNLDAIRELLETGKKVKGFTLGERGESLRIK